jgi:hypothetical protein
MGAFEDDMDEAMRLQRKELAVCDTVIEQVKEELYKATRKHLPMVSAHEGYAVLLEEVDELWQEIKHGSKKDAKAEAIQVAAMAIRLIANIYPRV